MVLKLKPVQTKKIVAAPSPVTFEPVSKRTSTKYDDNKIAERIPIEEVSPNSGMPNILFARRSLRAESNELFSAKIRKIRTSNLGRGSIRCNTRRNATTKTSTWSFVK